MKAKVNAYAQLMRLDKPAGIWLLFWPGAWAITLASDGTGWQILALFLLGALVMRSAGCIINDMADRHFDRQVERTKTRPLASGVISMREGFALLGALLLCALAIVLQLPIEVFWLACLSLPLITAYPFMKRITWWPQAFLGLTFNFGALMGWAAITETLPAQAWLLYAAGFLWTLGYDTIYGHQDKADDVKIGVKSSSLRLGEHTKLFVALCYALTLALLISVSYVHPLWLFVAGALGWQVWYTHIDRPATCMRAFKANQWVGALIWGVLFATTHENLRVF